MDLAVIIVTWNSEDDIANALDSLYADLETTNLHTRVIVVDSASSDSTVDIIRSDYPNVQLIASDENLGFGRANNAGMRSLGFGDDVPLSSLPPAVYLLNPDTLTQQGATQTLYDELLRDDTRGVVGARLTYGDGTHQHAGFTFPDLRQLWVEFFPTPGRFIEGRFNGRYPRSHYEGTAPFEVDFMLGATMMLRREVIQQVGMFDPNFFMYGEEVDWQWRIRKAGWRILCIPQAHVVHLVGKSTSQAKPRSIINLWESRLYLFRKHYPKWKYRIAKRLIVRGMSRKINQSRTQNEDESIIDAYTTVRELALKP